MENIYSKKQYYFVGFSSFVISVLGLILSISTFNIIKNSLGFISEERKYVGLYWLFKPLTLFIGTTKNAFDVWEVFLMVLLLVGSIIFLLKKRDTRLIAFVFSIILIGNAQGMFNTLFYFLYTKKKIEAGTDSIIGMMMYLYPVVGALYIFVSYKILTIIKSKKVLDITHTETSTVIKDTPKIQRFFHFLIDTFIILLVFCPLVFNLFEAYLIKIPFFRKSLNNEFGALMLIVIIRFIYYPFFEILFGSTPAKFLTESRVISSTAEKPSVSDIFKRTLYRNIPFNAVSFFWKTGLHDSLSYTHVVKEKREGFKTGYLLIALAVFIPYVYFYYFGEKIIMDYRTSKIDERMIKYEGDFGRNSVENINSNQVYILKRLGSMIYEGKALKIERIEGNEIICKELVKKDTYDLNYYGLIDLYKQQKDTATVYRFTKNDFMNAIPKNIREMDEEKRNGTNFFDQYGTYEIKNIYTLNAPFIEEGEIKQEYSMKNRSNVQQISFKNIGKSGRVISIKTVEGKVIWKDKFPIKIMGSNTYSDRFLVNVGDLKAEDTFSADMEVADSLNNKQMYKIEMDQAPYPAIRIYQLK
ncbi:RDD family protein [Chryseobacterium sp. M5A1_1a]